MRKSGFINHAILFFIFIISCKESGEVKILKLAHALAHDHSVHLGMVYMAELVEQKS